MIYHLEVTHKGRSIQDIQFVETVPQIGDSFSLSHVGERVDVYRVISRHFNFSRRGNDDQGMPVYVCTVTISLEDDPIPGFKVSEG